MITKQESLELKKIMEEQAARTAAFKKEQAEQMAGLKAIFEKQQNRRAERAKRAAKGL